jgi:hypothetical protein
LRGGSWNNNANNARCANRNNNNPDNRNNNIGFRCVLAVDSAPKVVRAVNKQMGEVLAGQAAGPASAKRPPNPSIPAPEKPGKKRGAGRGR